MSFPGNAMVAHSLVSLTGTLLLPSTGPGTARYQLVTKWFTFRWTRMATRLANLWTCWLTFHPMRDGRMAFVQSTWTLMIVGDCWCRATEQMVRDPRLSESRARLRSPRRLNHPHPTSQLMSHHRVPPLLLNRPQPALRPIKHRVARRTTRVPCGK